MESINVLERFDFHSCSVCTINSANLYLNIFQNVISFRNNLFSLSQIIQETLNFKLDEKIHQSHEICVNCKKTLVKFFIFKKTNEEARKMFNRSNETECMQKEPLLNELQIENTFDDENGCEEEIIDNMSDIGGQEEEFPKIDAYSVSPQENVLELNTSQLSQNYEINVSLNTEKKAEKWKRNKRKLAKNSGKSYVTSKGKVVNAKEMKSNCGTCRLKCTKNLTEEHRLNNFKKFYALADIRQQRKFLFEHMKSFLPKKSPSNSNCIRNVQRNFYLEIINDNETVKMVQVCRRMFLNTLSISSQMIDTLQKKITFEHGKIEDYRGKYKRKKFNIK